MNFIKQADFWPCCPNQKGDTRLQRSTKVIQPLSQTTSTTTSLVCRPTSCCRNIKMDFFRKTFLNLFSAAQVAFDQNEAAFSAANEAWKANQVALVADGWEKLQREAPWSKTATKRRANKAALKTNIPAPRGFPAEIFLQDQDKAFAQASLACNMPGEASQLILWTDASAGSRRYFTFTGHAVVFKRAGSWVRISRRYVAPDQSILAAELRAIELALDFAVQLVQHNVKTEKPQVVKIFTDSQSSLREIAWSQASHKVRRKSHRRKLRRGQPAMVELLQVMTQRAQLLEKARVQLELHWVPRN